MHTRDHLDADHVDRYAHRDGLDLSYHFVWIGCQVGFRQHDFRNGSALPSGREIALQATEVGRCIQPVNDPNDVDV
jgi:hypothetical protein